MRQILAALFFFCGVAHASVSRTAPPTPLQTKHDIKLVTVEMSMASITPQQTIIFQARHWINKRDTLCLIIAYTQVSEFQVFCEDEPVTSRIRFEDMPFGLPIIIHPD